MKMGSKPLAIAMDYIHFLRDSDGRVYDLPTDINQAHTELKKGLSTLVEQIREKAKQRDVIILSENLFPNSHIVTIEPKWWYHFLSGLTTNKPSIKLIHDRGTSVGFCNSCNHKIPVYLIRYNSWKCPHCKSEQETTANILKNMLRDYSFHQKTRPKKVKRKRATESSSHLKYLFGKIPISALPRTDTYLVETDKKSASFLRAMAHTCERLRSDMVKELETSQSNGEYSLDYRGWVDNWYENHGAFSRYRKNGKKGLASLSIADTLIAYCEYINDHQQLPKESDTLWVVYWRNIIVDRATNRITLPRFRGRYIQLDDNVIIPSGNCFVEISVSTNEEIYLRFVLGGNNPLKEEPIMGKHFRGRNRRTTRKPRSKYLQTIVE